MIFIGMVLYGFCDGYFGRDYHSHMGSRVEGFGSDWIVVRSEFGNIFMANFESTEEMLECINKWKEDPDDK